MKNIVKRSAYVLCTCIIGLSSTIVKPVRPGGSLRRGNVPVKNLAENFKPTQNERTNKQKSKLATPSLRHKKRQDFQDLKQYWTNIIGSALEKRLNELLAQLEETTALSNNSDQSVEEQIGLSLIQEIINKIQESNDNQASQQIIINIIIQDYFTRAEPLAAEYAECKSNLAELKQQLLSLQTQTTEHRKKSRRRKKLPTVQTEQTDQSSDTPAEHEEGQGQQHIAAGTNNRYVISSLSTLSGIAFIAWWYLRWYKPKQQQILLNKNLAGIRAYANNALEQLGSMQANAQIQPAPAIILIPHNAKEHALIKKKTGVNITEAIAQFNNAIQEAAKQINDYGKMPGKKHRTKKEQRHSLLWRLLHRYSDNVDKKSTPKSPRPPFVLANEAKKQLFDTLELVQ